MPEIVEVEPEAAPPIPGALDVLAEQLRAQGRMRLNNLRAAPRHWDVLDELNLAAEAMPVGPKAANGSQLWTKILNAVREIYEPAYACIAGGAIRDFVMGDDAKDIDVFINLPDDAFDAKKFVDQAEELGWQGIHKVARIDPYLKDNKRGLTQAVVKGIVDGWSVDLIVTKGKTGEEIVKAFDFHICHQWYDGQIHNTKEAAFDIKKGCWTPSRPLSADTKAHFERVNNRLGKKYKINTGEPWYMKHAGKKVLK